AASRWFVGLQSFCKQLEIRYRRFIGTQSLLEMAACSLTDLTPATYFDAPPPISIAFSVAQSRPSYPFSFRRNFKWLSTVNLPKRLASRSRKLPAGRRSSRPRISRENKFGSRLAFQGSNMMKLPRRLDIAKSVFDAAVLM